MKSRNDLWEEIGALEEDDPSHVLTKLFAMYEQKLKSNPDDQNALLFFRNLAIAMSEVTACNLNRR